MRRFCALLAVTFGVALFTWAVYQFVGFGFLSESKYSPSGRESGSMLVAALIGLCAFVYGVWEIVVFRCRRK
jgi:hypothetical protein